MESLRKGMFYRDECNSNSDSRSRDGERIFDVSPMDPVASIAAVLVLIVPQDWPCSIPSARQSVSIPSLPCENSDLQSLHFEARTPRLTASSRWWPGRDPNDEVFISCIIVAESLIEPGFVPICLPVFSDSYISRVATDVLKRR